MGKPEKAAGRNGSQNIREDRDVKGAKLHSGKSSAVAINGLEHRAVSVRSVQFDRKPL